MNNNTKEIFTWGEGNWVPGEATKHLNVEYTPCEDEHELLNKFMEWWANNYPDIITGWNSQLFDIPYLVSRIGRLFDSENNDAKNVMSPFNMTRRRTIRMHNKELTAYDIKGVAQLDYLDLYKKFTYTAQESYKLDYIAEVELGKNKLESGYDTFREFYEKDWNRFIDYNIIDTKLVDELEDKMKLIELIATMAYDAKCNFGDIYSSVRTWDCLLFNHLLDKNIMIPQRKNAEGRRIEGAYVQEPKPGKYDWVMSFDATSLYPSIIMQYNMSPETLVPGMVDCTVDSLLERKTVINTEYAVASNGQTFRRDKQGLFPEIVSKFFDDRQKYKKLMIAAQNEYEKTKDKSLLNDIAKYNNFQMARKIQLNSLFGAMGNEYFRYYDTRIAEGITMTGQFLIRQTAQALDSYINKVCGTEGEMYSFYSDTDSCYITMDKLVQKFFKGMSKDKIVDNLDKIGNDKIEPAINKAMEDIANYTNAFEQKIFFKREAISERGIWVAKKRYAMNVSDNEGVRYKEPKLKVMGLEIVRSSTPAPVRESLRQAVSLILSTDEKTLQSFVAKNWEEFSKLSPEQIAFPRGCNNLEKYSSSSHIYEKGTPMHVRGALMFNFLLGKHKLGNKYERIQDGDKIKFLYLKEPNIIGENTIAFPSKLPPEYDVHRYVDYETIFQKSFVEPLNTIVDGLGWNTRPVATLEDLFG
jgi:DNA polymerase elongation subunit (family B)